mmetsp:Transcript_29289/g.85881  ORF Transcript_29289/g.85881 Transcript_29289/m.85881 type:complete len:491 (-) Transcript_29289:376-1848(-)
MGRKVYSDDLEAQRPFCSRLCTGDLNFALNCICCLPVMTWNALLIFARPCFGIYLWSILDLLFCGCVRLVCPTSCWQHKDKKFPPTIESIGEWDGKSAAQLESELEWRRASEYFTEKLTDDEKKRRVRVKLFEGGVHPKDVAQGQLGNCWLITAFACMAEHPAIIKKAFVTKRANPWGKYKVSLFDGRRREWVTVSVDENIPIVKASGRPLFADPNGRELWVLMLEKAFAKFCGSYTTLKGGHVLWAFNAITGDPVFALAQEGGKWKRQNVQFDEQVRKVSFIWSDEEYSSEDAFFLLRRYCRVKTLVGASISNDGEKNLDNGLVMGHAYSVLDARSFKDKKAPGGRVNLIQLRNPWGEHEWTGAWSDSSKEWKEYPTAKKILKPKDDNDGTFWMSWEDFSKFYTRIDICQRSTGLNDLNIDLKEADGCANCIGPCLGCCTGCGRYWCCGEGCRALYCDTKASSKTMEIGDHGRDDDLAAVVASTMSRSE